MRVPVSRRVAIGAVLGLGGIAMASPPVRRYLDLAAPGSGRAWSTLGERPDGPIESPWGPATVAVDDEGVPHVTAEDERALQFAHGFVQGADRLFQLDLFRRRMRGELSAVVGDVTLGTDEFHVRMGFAEAAAASRTALEGTETMTILEAFVAGVNRARERLAEPLEAGLLGYEIEPWTATDSLLTEKLMGWELTGRFRTLRRLAVAERFGSAVAADLYPGRLDHDVPILSDGDGTIAERVPVTASIPKPTVDWLSRFESPPGVGSNSWVIGSSLAAGDGPLLANDPHLSLTVPPIWYEVGLETPAFATRGVTFPGSPFVVIGRNRSATWGFTTVPADVIDFYRYDVDGDRYRYGDEWRPFETVERTIEVADGPDRHVAVRRTVHGPFIERAGAEVAVGWTGLGATRTIAAVRDFQFAEDLDAFVASLERWDLPPQNLVYADVDGRTLYQVTGKVPIRRVDGEAVRADRVFDGSEAEGEWAGFEPYGQPTWEDVVPLEELPRAIDAEVVVTANQRPQDDPEWYFAETHAAPYRARRIVELLDGLADAGPIDAADLRRVQQDVRDELAVDLVPQLLDAVDPTTADREWALETLSTWDRHMRVDSTGALLFSRWLAELHELVFVEPLEAAGFGRSYVPSDWVLATLPATHPWYDEVGERDGLMAGALDATIDAIARDDTLGDVQRSAIDHPLGLDFLGHPRHPMPGSPTTVKNFRLEAGVGPGWQQVVDPANDAAWGRLAGGNSGRYFSSHYDDQLRPWIDGRYKPVGWDVDPAHVIQFEGDAP